MENMGTKGDILGENQHKNKVHRILANSYSVSFLFFLAGVLLDLLFKLKFLNFSFMVPTGIVLIFLASLLILWAQKTSRNLKKENLSKESFNKGPYAFTRSPTHWGLFFLMFGFGIMNSAVFIVTLSIISFIFTKFIYLKKEEIILEKKYGAPYLEYKKLVRF